MSAGKLDRSDDIGRRLGEHDNSRPLIHAQ
jgi:hypothetical protein